MFPTMLVTIKCTPKSLSPDSDLYVIFLLGQSARNVLAYCNGS